MRFVSILFAAALSLAAHAELQVVELSAGMHRIRAELAETFADRMRGLMYREKLAPNSGMLFVFDGAEVQCMWMKNTLLPLSVAFVDDTATIINIEDMQPHTEDSHCSKRPARYALEMERGWFAERGIKPGAKLRGIERLKPR